MPSLDEANISNRLQQLTDRISIAEADVNPVLAMIPKENGFNEWNLEEPAQVYPSNAFMPVMDGVPVTQFNSTSQERIKARGQELRYGFGVTQQAGIVRSAGVRSQIAKQRADGALIFARMIEQMLCSDQDSAELNKATNQPNQTRGLWKWIQSAAQGHYPVPESLRPGADQHYTAAFADIDQRTFTGILIAAWKKRNGAKSMLDMPCGADLQDKVDDFTYYDKVPSGKTLLRTVQTTEQKQWSRAVNVISSSFGTVRVHPTPWLLRDRTTGLATDFSHKSGALLDLSMWKLRWIQSTMFHKLPNDGSGEKEYINAMFMLMCRNPIGQGSIRPSS